MEQNETRGLWSGEKVHDKWTGVLIRCDKTSFCWDPVELVDIQVEMGIEAFAPNRAAA